MLPSEPQANDIAVIGLSCRVAGAKSSSELWHNLLTSQDSQSRISRFNIDGFYHPAGAKRKGLTNVQHAYLLEQSLDRFDAAFFSIPPTEATAMDPQQRLLLELTYEAIESAGIPLERFQGTQTAVYTGIFGNDYGNILSRDLDATPKYNSTGTSNSIAANRISYFFDLKGPSMSIDTACSSTIVALHQAMSALKGGEVDMAVVSGSNLILNADMFIHMSELGFLSPSGRCKSFDASGDGYARAEGVLALILKPYSKALEDGDPIRSIIKGTRINQDGRTQGITLPSCEAQQANLEGLYRSEHLDPADTQYLEAHGTGTAAGDPIELSAINAVFGPSCANRKLIVGSIKSCIGHLESGAALAGILKTVLCLENGLIPPQMHFSEPNPKIDFSHIEIPTSVMEWPETANGTRRAGVNSFGFGGTNGACVLDYYPTRKQDLGTTHRELLFKVSAHTTESLERLCDSYAHYLETSSPSLIDFAHTTLTRRSTLRKSFFFSASNREAAVSQLKSSKKNMLTREADPIPTVGAIFTGQGAQWVQMGKQLIDQSPLFRAVLEECDRVLHSLPDGPTWSIIQELSMPGETSKVYISNYAQPLCTALQLGLIAVWQSWGLSPSFVLGHSSGEVAAAYTAGMISLQHAAIIAYYRGLFLGKDANPGGPKGAMCAIGLSGKACEELLIPYKNKVALAATNSPSSSTLSGDADAIKEIIDHASDKGIFCRALKVDMAYHSHHMLPMSERYQQALTDAGVTYALPPASSCPMFSSVTGKRLTPQECTPQYWKTNMVSTVRFKDALTAAVQANRQSKFSLVEVGPHPALKGPATDTLVGLGVNGVSIFNSCLRGKPDMEALLLSVASMAVQGVSIDLKNVNAVQSVEGLTCLHQTGTVLTDMPHYAWDHRASFWAESHLSHNHRARKHRRHALLGARVAGDDILHPTWRNLLILREVDWLHDLKIAGHELVPSAVFILMAVEAARQLAKSDAIPLEVQLRDFAFHQDLPLAAFASEETTFEIHLNASFDKTSGSYRFDISGGLDPANWSLFCSGGIFPVYNGETQELSHPPAVKHNPKLVEYMNSWIRPLPQDIISLRLSKTAISGKVNNHIDSDEHYFVDPKALVIAILAIESICATSGILSKYQLQQIRCITLSSVRGDPTGADLTEKYASFSGTISRPSTVLVHGNGLMTVPGACSISLHDMQWIQKTHLTLTPPLKSLFFKGIYESDITLMRPSTQELHITRLVDLVTHKWPMADIGVTEHASKASPALLKHLQISEKEKRPRFRSMTLLGEKAPVSTAERTFLQESFDDGFKAHLIVGTNSELELVESSLHPQGVACLELANSEEVDEAFETLCSVTGLDDGSWCLVRRKTPRSSERHVKVIMLGESTPLLQPSNSTDELDIVSIGQGSDLAMLEPNADVIVLDCGHESVLTSWAGKDLMLWLKPLLSKAGRLVWVTRQSGAQSDGSVPGSFLRTIKAENPAFRAKSVHLAHVDLKDFSTTIWAAYDSIVNGDAEMELIATHDARLQTLRYKPDDMLAASVGRAPPMRQHMGFPYLSYRLGLSGVSSVSFFLDSVSQHNVDDLTIQATHSLIDDIDVRAFRGVLSSKTLGQFFIGIVTRSRSTEFQADELAVGWTATGAHQNEVYADPKHCLTIRENMNTAEFLTSFATHCIAQAVVFQARAKPHDTYFIRPSNRLEGEIDAAFISIGSRSVASTPADLEVDIDAHHGVRLNGRAVDMHKFMMTGFDKKAIIQSLSSEMPQEYVSVSSRKFPLGEAQQAFELSIDQPFSIVLDHTLDSGSLAAIKTRRLSEDHSLFRSDGCYVIVGFGGLGAYLASWMVAHGAQSIFAITRSGPDSAQALQASATVRDAGGSLTVLKGNALEYDSLASCLSSIRQQSPILGVFNMVMVLQDNSFESMSSQQWDAALSAKVRTTQNLHSATLQDMLDFFIMFSSVSSIFGNRTQSNYASGNAYQNDFASYRRSIGLPTVAIALGAVTGIGVLADNFDLQRSLRQSGLAMVEPEDFENILEAAVLECMFGTQSLIVTGFEMFPAINGKIQAPPDQNQVFWAEMPEFGFLLDHQCDQNRGTEISIQERIQAGDHAKGFQQLLKAFLGCISSLLGYSEEALDPSFALTEYGLDSSNAVACRYWFFKELEIDVPIFDIIGCKSINDLVERVMSKIQTNDGNSTTTKIPDPVRMENLEVRPLSHSQRRLWFLHSFIADKTVYNLLLVSRVQGKLDANIFHQAWTALIRRHEILHSGIADTAHGLQQKPIQNPYFELVTKDVSDEAFIQEEGEITREARSHVFDIENGELVKGWLLRSGYEQRFFLASHHLAWDRQSVPTIFDDLVTIYQRLENGTYSTNKLPEVPYQFTDYTVWQNECLSNSEITKPQVDYWSTTLQGIPDCVSLLPVSISDSRPPVKHYDVDNFAFTINKTITDELKDICKKRAVTPFMLMASAVTALVYRLTGDTDIVVGIPDGDRGHPAFDSMIGFTVNMLAIRSTITPDMTYESFLEKYREACLGAYQNRLVPFDYLLHQLNIPRRTNHSPVFQVSVNYQLQGAFPEYDFGNFKLHDHEHHNARTQTDLGFEVEETKQGTLHCVLDFDTSLYGLEAIKEVAGLYQQLLHSIVQTGASSTIDSLNLVCDADRHFISSQLRPHEYDAAKLNALAERSFELSWDSAVETHGSKVALIDERFRYTYSELDTMTSKIANRLIQSGTSVMDRVVVFTPQDSFMVLAMYGIVRAGAAYVPISTDFPEERINSMVEDTEARVALVDRMDSDKLQALISAGFAASNILSVEDIIETDDANSSRPRISRKIRPDDTFCCIFTSGSTGKPKGINILHGSLRYQMEGYNNFIETKPSDKILLSSAMVFDLSLPAIYGSILFGSTLVVASQESKRPVISSRPELTLVVARLSPDRMINLLVDEGISNCIFTPTQFKILFSARNHYRLNHWKSLRSLVLGGEQIPPWLIGKFFDLQIRGASIFNGYAPAETTVVNALKRLSMDHAIGDQIPSASPLWPTSFTIVDGNMHEVPVGIPGELIIGGPTVNKGYIKRDEATKKAFLRNESASSAEIEDGHGLAYRTGDRFCLGRDGTLHSCGRIGGDRQVKIRGMRTELGEIENSIWSLAQDMEEYGEVALQLVAVVFHKIGEDDGILVAYLSCTDNIIPDEDDQHAARDFLRSGLTISLPTHMIPSAYVFIEDMPRTATGKTDHKALLARQPPERAVNGIVRETEDSTPLNKNEEDVATAWASALNSQVTFQVADNFFKCGGHSLLLMNVQYQLEKATGINVSLADMFANPTIGGMANLLRKPNGEDSTLTPSKTASVSIDWQREASLDVDWFNDKGTVETPKAVILTGATGLAGAHFLECLLRKTTIDIYCVAVPARTNEDALTEVLSTLNYWRLTGRKEEELYRKRIHAFAGSLSQDELGLSSAQVLYLDRSTQAIYHLDSQVSLLKNYETIRAANVGATKFLVDLAYGRVGNLKAMHYLSTWGVLHLQTWNETQHVQKGRKLLTSETPMSHIVPDHAGELGYLKARWACEAVLLEAAERGIPTTIYRSSMFTPAPSTAMSLMRSDINRRIIVASIHTGAFPDFGSAQGGGMTWVTADFLAEAMLHLGHRSLSNTGRPRIFHLVSENHIRYNELPGMLQHHQNVPTGKEKALEAVPPETWFKMLKDNRNAEMSMQAEVLERMWAAGWLPFQIESHDTLALLKKEADIEPLKFDASMLSKLVVGSQGF